MPKAPPIHPLFISYYERAHSVGGAGLTGHAVKNFFFFSAHISFFNFYRTGKLFLRTGIHRYTYTYTPRAKYTTKSNLDDGVEGMLLDCMLKTGQLSFRLGSLRTSNSIQSTSVLVFPCKPQESYYSFEHSARTQASDLGLILARVST